MFTAKLSTSLRLSLLLGSLAALGAGCERGLDNAGCSDGKDGDGDGLIDFADVDDCPRIGDYTPGYCDDIDADGSTSGNDEGCSNDDCDDDDASIHPGAIDIPGDGIDQDCDGSDAPVTDPDADGDSYPASTDCNDNDATVNPGALEDPALAGLEIDVNCDGQVFCFVDADDDGIAVDAVATVLSTDTDCDDAGEGDNGTDFGDCDDNNAAINPFATEVCDGQDNDCADGADDGLPTTAWYPDVDGDTFGDASAAAVQACSALTNTVASNTDCNDSSAAVNPDAAEVCDGVDNDCAGGADNGLETTAWYPDADADTFGDASAAAVQACSAPANTVASNTDCNDSSAAVNPDATEVCDGVDNDCAGGADNGLPTTAWYPDVDGDTFGDASAAAVQACAAPTDTVDSNTDCDDGSATVYPGATEVCDGQDNDCADGADDGLATTAWYPDLDGDTFGDASAAAVQACSAPADTVASNTDCDDSSATVYFGATELVANGIDEDCDTQELCFADADGDGSYDAAALAVSSTHLACDGVGEAGMAGVSGECDDGNAAVYPGATEICNGIDDNCVDGADEGFSPSTFYADADGDTYGDPNVSQASCLASLPDHVTNALDCDDTNIAINPDAVEVCDDVDSDCDALADLNDTDIVGPGAQTYTTTAGVTIGDLATATSTLEVLGGPASITQVEVIVSLQHTWLSDLTITLTSPAGTPVILMSSDGGSGDNLDATYFTEDATSDINGAGAGSAPFAGQWLPQQSLDAFQGEAGSGTWTLTVQDSVSGDVGTLTGWSLILDDGLGGNPDNDADGAVATCGDCDDADPNNAPDFIEVCDDASDNDCDVAADCTDTECALDPLCAGGPTETVCDDTFDDDGDSFFDCDDSDCDLDPACGPATETLCTDGLDNDGDGPMDYMDPDCEVELATVCGSMPLPLIPNPHSGTCLFFSGSPLQWAGADNACTTLGGYLAVVDSAAENTLVRNSSDINTQLWLGFSDFAPESNDVAAAFQDVVGGNGTSDYHNFDGGEPNGGTSENCVAYFEFPFRSGYTWNDAVCTANYTYICEIEP